MTYTVFGGTLSLTQSINRTLLHSTGSAISITSEFTCEVCYLTD